SQCISTGILGQARAQRQAARGPSPRALDERDGWMIQEGRPERSIVASQPFRREFGRMPPKLPEPGEATRGLVRRRAQMVVLDLEGSIIQVEGPGDRHPLLPASSHARLESVLAIRRSIPKRQRRAAIDGDEAAPGPHAPGEPVVHHLELLGVMRVVQHVSRDHEVELAGGRQLPGIAHDVLDPESLLSFLCAGQLDHPVRKIDTGHVCRTSLSNHAGVEAFSAAHVEDGQPAGVTDQVHQREALDVGTPRLQLGPFVLLGDGIVASGHRNRAQGPRREATLIREDPASAGRNGQTALLHRVRPLDYTSDQEGGSMAIKLPESARKVLQDKAYGHVVTSASNGRPQVTMVWMDAEGDEVLFNTAEGRTKLQNLRRDPHVTISVQDRHNPQAYLLVHGTASAAEAGADAHIDKLAKRFLGVDKYPYRQPGEKRLLVRVQVDRLGGFAPGMKPWQ